MTNEQAISILTQVALKFVGTRQDHELVEAALKHLAEAIKPKEEKSES
jgi:hypothetical protein